MMLTKKFYKSLAIYIAGGICIAHGSQQSGKFVAYQTGDSHNGFQINLGYHDDNSTKWLLHAKRSNNSWAFCERPESLPDHREACTDVSATFQSGALCQLLFKSIARQIATRIWQRKREHSKQHRNVLNRRKYIRSEIDKTERKLAEMRRAYQVAAADIHTMDDQIKNIRMEIQHNEQRQGETAKLLTETQTRIAELLQKVSDYASGSEEVRSQNDKIHQLNIERLDMNINLLQGILEGLRVKQNDINRMLKTCKEMEDLYNKKNEPVPADYRETIQELTTNLERTAKEVATHEQAVNDAKVQKEKIVTQKKVLDESRSWIQNCRVTEKSLGLEKKGLDAAHSRLLETEKQLMSDHDDRNLDKEILEVDIDNLKEELRIRKEELNDKASRQIEEEHKRLRKKLNDFSRDGGLTPRRDSDSSEYEVGVDKTPGNAPSNIKPFRTRGLGRVDSFDTSNNEERDDEIRYKL